jgi:hypothetical protein
MTPNLSALNITLSWDLFIIVFFATVMTFSFIMGKLETVKIVICTYIAILASQGIGNVLVRITGESSSVLQTMGLSADIAVLSIAKIAIFVILLITLMIKSGIDVHYESDVNFLVRAAYTILFGFSIAGLIVSTILSYASGRGILDTELPSVIAGIAGKSTLMQIMILNQDLWFALPALLLIGVGVMRNR